VGKRDAEASQQALDELFARVQEEMATVVETAVRAWALQVGKTPEEWSELYRPVVRIRGDSTRPSLVIEVHAEAVPARRREDTHGR
jgi:hypothetical protein